jgi:5-methylcytosine-specific restriction endonuclease McrA
MKMLKCEWCQGEFQERGPKRFCCDKCRCKAQAKKDAVRIAAYKKEWEKQNRERLRVKKQQWRDDNQEYLLEYYRQYREDHHEELAIYQKEYSAEHREKDKKRRRLYYEIHREEILEYQKNYQKEHKEEIAQASAARRAKNPDQERARRQARRVESATYVVARKNRKRSSREKRADYMQWMTATKKQEYFTCAWCHKTFRVSKGNEPTSLVFDHVVPLSINGTDERTNLVVSCRRCNGRKGAKNPSGWIDELAGRGISFDDGYSFR